MWPRVNQMSRTLLFHTLFSQIRYQFKVITPTHYDQNYRISFVSSIFEVKQFLPGEGKLFWASLYIYIFQQVIFEATKGWYAACDIAIDDVVFMEGVCPESKFTKENRIYMPLSWLVKTDLFWAVNF